MAIWVAGQTGTIYVIDPNARRITADLRFGGAISLTIGEGAVWVVGYDEGTVTRVDPVSLRSTAVIPMEANPTHAIAGVGAVWVNLQVFGGRLVKIDPSTNLVSPAGIDGFPKAAGRTWLWVDQHRGFDRSALVRFDPGTDGATEIGEFWNMGSIVTDDRAVWLSHQPGRDSVLSSLDPSLSRIAQTFLLPDRAQPRSMTIVEDMLVVAGHFQAGTRRPLFRLDPATGEALATLVLASHYDLVAGYGAVWACDVMGREVLRLDPTAMAVTDRIDVGDHLRAIAVEPDGLSD